MLTKSLIISAILSMTILITKEHVIQNLPIGTPRAEVESYLREIGAEYIFLERHDYLGSQKYPWREDEIGVYSAGVDKVRTHWWLPSLGSVMGIRIGISRDGAVTQVLADYGQTGLP